MRFIKTIVVFILVLALNAINVQASDYLQMGKNALQKKDYSKAMQYISMSVKQNRYDPVRVYYLGLVLRQINEPARAKRAFETALKLNPSSKIASKIKRQLNILNNPASTISVYSSPAVRRLQQRTKGKNYLDQAMAGATVSRWDLSKMPLKVYIANGNKISGFVSDYRTSVIKSLKAWERASRGKIRFTVTNSKTNSDIVVDWVDGFVGEKVGESPYVAVGGVIIRSDVNLSTKMPDGSPMVPKELYAISLHEFGHALGIKGHSPYPDDVMYFAYNQKNYNGMLTQSDTNTIRMLYQLDADVTNKMPLNQTQTKEFFRNQLEGDKLFLAKDFARALKYYLAAYNIYGKEFMTNYNIGACYMNTGDPASAIQYYENAVSISPEDTMSHYYLGIAQINVANKMVIEKNSGAQSYFKSALRNMNAISRNQDRPSDTDSLISKLNAIIQG